jgi:DNA mismatch repair ATPase MutS
VVRSCIGRADDPASGKSYYLVEVEAVLGLVTAARQAAPHLFLFDELFRGTNTIERIAAGEAVLAALLHSGAAQAPSPHVVIAATHDQELVDLLRGLYVPYHFTDRVGDEGLIFDYELRSGPARTRSAIALLRLRGAPADLVAQATARANALDRSRDPREHGQLAPDDETVGRAG